MELYLVVFIVFIVGDFLATPPSSPADAELSAQIISTRGRTVCERACQRGRCERSGCAYQFLLLAYCSKKVVQEEITRTGSQSADHAPSPTPPDDLATSLDPGNRSSRFASRLAYIRPRLLPAADIRNFAE